jgi:type IV pilus biogenesis protein PilP
MKFDPARLLGPLVAALMLVLVVQQTLGALRASGVWEQRHAAHAPPVNPFAPLESLLAFAGHSRSDALRDPFAFGHAAAPVVTRKPVAPRPAPAPVPVEPERPVLTSIVWVESNPSATLRFNGRDYPVQTNTLFDEFRVQSITRDQVTLVRGGETLVLKLPKKGD